MKKLNLNIAFYILMLFMCRTTFSFDLDLNNIGVNHNHNHDHDHIRHNNPGPACPICWEERGNTHTLICGHRLCQDCLTTIVNNASREQSLIELRCPIEDCRRNIDAADLRRIYFVEQEVIDRIIALIDAINNPVARPRDENEDIGIQPLLDQEIIRPCPRCQAPIEKNEGCLHMTCRQCRHQFCWGCRQPWGANDNHPTFYQCLASNTVARGANRFPELQPIQFDQILERYQNFNNRINPNVRRPIANRSSRIFRKENLVFLGMPFIYREELFKLYESFKAYRKDNPSLKDSLNVAKDKIKVFASDIGQKIKSNKKLIAGISAGASYILFEKFHINSGQSLLAKLLGPARQAEVAARLNYSTGGRLINLAVSNSQLMNAITSIGICLTVGKITDKLLTKPVATENLEQSSSEALETIKNEEANS